ncbi:6-carboxytetrahydropterin synthase QueD [Thermosediminibacter litoriperuensis]|uniref:6-carboxy-5,6,7,8-tetrahydropterin synthase n=1 Tax=Thermosediminibacter litoriperuensis TaxID=291989 RepID=A0A5S5ASU1_9FIRM|nr:6-pyruvoyltetrahydropterin/6-carboxytetrahydropterin synthase [Thermosediminibacter litoriperuensis]
MFLIKEFKFDAAHNLVKYKGKCEKLHGHTYRLVVVLEGTPDAEGMIMDFLELKNIVEDRVLKLLDHSYINDFVEQPSAENIAVWVWKRLEERVNRENCRLYEVQVWETATSGAVYRGEGLEGRSE